MDKLVRAIELTNEILEMLDNQDFDKVADLESERAPLIRQAFTDTVDKIDQIKASHLQKLNQQVIDRLLDLKQSVMQQQQQIRKASRATRAYVNNQYHSSALPPSGQATGY